MLDHHLRAEGASRQAGEGRGTPQDLAEGALHITVYDLLAHAYNRVAIQYYHRQGTALSLDQSHYSPLHFTPALPEQMREEVIEALFADSARALATFFGFEEMNFVVLDHQQGVYRLMVREGAYFPRFQAGTYTQPFGTGLLGTCHISKRSVLSNDVSQVDGYVRTDPAVRAELCVPVQVGDEVLAIIDSGASRVNAFRTSDLRFIEGFARYLGPAVADPEKFLQSQRPGLVQADSALAPLAQSLNFLSAWHEEWRSRFAALYAETAQRNAELLALIALSDSLATSLRLETILHITVAKVAQLLACQMSWISLPDDDGHLKVRALFGERAAVTADTAITADGSPQYTVFMQGEAAIINDVHRVARSSFDRAFCQRNGITRYLSAPLRVRERTIGVMSIGRTHGASALTDYDLRLLSTFANHIALAIENADLFERSRRLGAIEERSRVARDLHDTLTQSILGILRTLEAITPELLTAPPAVLQAIEDSRLFAKESLDEARRSIWNLTPAGLENRGLPEAIQEYVELWSRRTGIEASYQITGTPPRIAPTTAMDILHVAREALSNIAQHASAGQAVVRVDFTASALCVTISDDGIGMNPETIASGRADGVGEEDKEGGSARSGFGAPRGGLGLGGMRERARLLNGWLQLESEPGRGTQIVLTIPDLNRPAAERVAPAGDQYADNHLYHVMESGTQILPPQNSWISNGVRPYRDESPITIVLVDDHPALRSGLRLALSKVAGLQVIGTASSGAEALIMARELHPDILLLDVQMPDQDGISVLRKLRLEQVPVRVVMLTAHFADAYITEALQNGAAGFLYKDVEIEDLAQAIRLAYRGHLALSPSIAARLRDRSGLLVNPAASHFTAREREVLDLLSGGMRYQAIARQLCISQATVKFHVINLYQKLQSHSRVEALNRAREWGLLRS
jgi:DNA-binding NarL/FixJ family response regulator/signal transduction histidine kinase